MQPGKEAELKACREDESKSNRKLYAKHKQKGAGAAERGTV